MKKILQLIIAIALMLPAVAQHTTPRFGNPPGDDNTGRVLTYRYALVTDGPSLDTINLAPRAWTTIIQFTAKDTLSFNVPTLTNCYVGDELTFLVTNTAGSNHLVKFIGSNWQVGSGGASLALTASKRANITFVFDGVTWVEQSRLVQ